MNFVNWFWSFWNWFYNLIKLKDTNDIDYGDTQNIYWIHNQFITSKELGDCVYDTFKYFLKTKEYNEIGWLLLLSLDKVVQQTMSSGIAIPSSSTINDSKASRCALKESLISCSWRAEITENQTQNLSTTGLITRQVKLPALLLLGRNRILKVGVCMCEKILMKLGTLYLKF